MFSDSQFLISQTGRENRNSRFLLILRNCHSSNLNTLQVTEVLSRDKTRLSISGWFHGETAAFPRKADPLPLLKEPPVEDGVTEDEGGNRRP